MRAQSLRLAALALCLSSAVSAVPVMAQAPATPSPPAPSPSATPSQQPPAADTSNAIMSFEDYEPRSTLIVPQHPLTRARYPFIDVHNHQDSQEMTPEQVDAVATAMDGLNMAVMVNLSGGSGEGFQKGLANLTARHPNRFVQFANVDFKKIDEPNFGENAARQLEQDVKNGARGLKVFKNLGMFVKDKNGKRVQTDDPRIDPVWD
jgi:predicted TIM-barrel fold metal-dependent hydrolase